MTGHRSVLTKAQKACYKENGYVVVEKNLNQHLIDELIQRFRDICNGEITDHSVLVITKDPSLKNKGVKGEYLISKFQDFNNDECFWKYSSDKNVIDVVEEIIGPDITVISSMFINKPPNSETGASLHPLHQDLHYIPFKPADKIVASWTALERVDENNGCLYVIPGSHKGRLYRHDYPEGYKNVLYHEAQDVECTDKQHLVMEKGDTVFFHPLLLHGSGPNKTKGFRKIISCHYASNNCEMVDLKGTMQEGYAQEVEETIKKVGLKGVRFSDYWRIKSRLVRGKPGRIQKMTSSL